MKMRDIMAIVEATVGTISSRVTGRDVPVYNITSLRQLEGLLSRTRYRDIRAVLHGDELHCWDAEYAAHRAYEDQLGGHEGVRLMINGGKDGAPYGISYYANEITPEQIKDEPIMQRIFPPAEMDRMTFETLDDFT